MSILVWNTFLVSLPGKMRPPALAFRPDQPIGHALLSLRQPEERWIRTTKPSCHNAMHMLEKLSRKLA